MKKTLLTTCNAKYIHKNLALRWIYVTCPHKDQVSVKEYTMKDDDEHIVQDVLLHEFEVICFSCYIWNIEKTKRLIRMLKQRNASLHIIVGGPEVSYESYDVLNQGVDAISIGEGEKSVWEYIQMLDSVHHLVQGMYTREFPDQTYMRNDIAWLETFDNPYFLPMDCTDMDKRYFYLETSRGCPYGCTYCLSSQDRCVRMFSDTYVENILHQIAKSNIRQVKLLDRTFNCDPKRALRIARYMNEHCVNQIFQFEIVAETLSEELLAFFCEEANPGRFRFEIGVQSFHKETLQSVGRIQNNERLKFVIKKLHESSCTLHADLIAGLPFESIEQFEKSFNELFALGAGEVQLGILKLLKGTKLRSQKDQFHMKFDRVAPYTIQATQWVCEDEMIRIDQCAHAVEKFWNSGTCCYTIKVLLKQQIYNSAFALFMSIGESYAKLPRPYQPYELFQCIQCLFPEHQNQINALLLMDYYPRFRQKPHRFCEGTIDLDQKKQVLHVALEKGIANQDQLYRYGVVDAGHYDDQYGYQLVLFNTHQTYPKQYFLPYDMSYIKEVL